MPSRVIGAKGAKVLASTVGQHSVAGSTRPDVAASRRDPPRGLAVPQFLSFLAVLAERIMGVVRPHSVDTARERIVERLRPTEFDVFYRMSWHDIYAPLAVTIGDADLAREAVDEAMARAYARWSRVRSATNPEGWVYRVAYRWAVDRLRRRSRERTLVLRLSGGSSTDEYWFEPGLDAALSALPLEQRAVVVLTLVVDWSEDDIARALSIRPGTVKSRLHRGLIKLRRELSA